MGDIQVNDWDGFRSVLAQLNGLAGQIPARRDAGAKVLSAVTAAADSDGSTAPIYATSLTALGTCIESCGTHVDAAASAVQATLGELERIVNGQEEIQTDGAEVVQNL
nr:hypothetical protein [Mycobacterium sp. UM_NZ2]